MSDSQSKIDSEPKWIILQPGLLLREGTSIAIAYSNEIPLYPYGAFRTLRGAKEHVSIVIRDFT